MEQPTGRPDHELSNVMACENNSSAIGSTAMESHPIHAQDEKDTMKVFVGTFVHATRESPMVILTDMALGILNGKIEFVEVVNKLGQLRAKYGFPDSCITYMTPGQFMMPGMIDTHIHAPQFPNNGVKFDLPLLSWLNNYTFPMEAMFSDVKLARNVYTRVVERIVRNGTTTASYFASLHLPASKVLADVVHARGQRALVGKVNMIVNCPEYYQESSIEESLAETEELICYIANKQSPLVQPIITPRFGITCPLEQLKGLGQLAAKYDCHIQSHLCETKPEIAWIKELFPSNKSYTDVYDSTGLLGEKTIMAHCVWMEEEELNQLKERSVGVSHCPNSNLSIRSGHCDVRKLLKRGIKVGLGTDCSGGYSPSMLDAIRRAMHVSNTLAIQHENYTYLSLSEIFRLATLGGAQVVHMEDRIGNFETGKEFDSLLIDVEVPGSPLDIFSKDSTEDKVQKFLCNGDDRNIVQVYVAGKCLINNWNYSG
ncbi:guanine deaminase-like isoform X1 [Panulirus ornatus]|uniref:guanine deaminase-like isoform X1 n=1 Tax=Panulirus ornatus TaxID=150431 RepID=UPI003A8384ED